MTKDSSAPLAGKHIVITGATRGIGRAAAVELAREGATVIVHGRNDQSVAAVVETIGRRCRAGRAEGIVADLASQAAVRRLATEIHSRCDRLDVLVNNAGCATRTRQTTVDGLERQLAVNHLAPFLLTNLLLNRLRASAPARIVNVASNAHRRAAFDLNDLNWEKRPYQPLGAYGATKLANILFTRELARRLDGSGVTANSLHPGVVATHIFAGLGLAGTIFGILSKPLLLSPEKGARTTVYLCSSPDVAQVSGKFFDRSAPANPAAAALDDATAALLWQRSERLTGLAT